MNIIKAANPIKVNEAITYRATCYTCECVFEFKKSEGYSVPGNHVDARCDAIDCPECGGRVTDYGWQRVATR